MKIHLPIITMGSMVFDTAASFTALSVIIRRVSEIVIFAGIAMFPWNLELRRNFSFSPEQEEPKDVNSFHLAIILEQFEVIAET